AFAVASAQRVIAFLPIDLVVAGAGDQRIAAGASVQDVGAGFAEEPVDLFCAAQRVRAVSPERRDGEPQPRGARQSVVAALPPHPSDLESVGSGVVLAMRLRPSVLAGGRLGYWCFWSFSVSSGPPYPGLGEPFLPSPLRTPLSGRQGNFVLTGPPPREAPAE